MRLGTFVCALFVTVVAAATSTPAQADRVGFANVARDGVAGKAAIDAVRGRVVAGGKLEDLGDGVARRALEEAVDPAQSVERAAVTTAQARLVEAKDAFTRFDYDAALDRARQAETILRTVVPVADVVTALAEVNLMAGLVYVGRKDEARATEAFRLVHRLAPDRTALDPGLYKPQIVSLYEAAGKDTTGGETGVVAVTTEPAGATIWIDGRAVGTAPLELPALPPGDHYLAATFDGHAARAERIHVEPRQRLAPSFLLSRLPADERARAVRTGLLGGGVIEADWARAAAILADVASVDVLLVLRQQANGTLEAAVYDVRGRKLGPWRDAGDESGLVKALPKKPEDRIAIPDPRDVAMGHVGPGGPFDGRNGHGNGSGNGSGTPPTDQPWYKTGRAKVAGIIVASVLVAAGAVIVLSPSDDPTQMFVIPPDGFGWK